MLSYVYQTRELTQGVIFSVAHYPLAHGDVTLVLTVSEC